MPSIIGRSAFAVVKRHLIGEKRLAKKKKGVAEDGFDPSTSGLWAQHAPTAPLCLPIVRCSACQLYTCI